MMDERVELLAAERAAYDALACVFLELPTSEEMQRILSLPVDDLGGAPSAAALARFISENRGRPLDAVLEEVAKERVVMVRGTGVNGFRPPYESLYAYAEGSQNEAIGSLNRFYRENGFEKQKDLREAPDQIGVEFAFVSALIGREIACLEAGDLDGADAVDATIGSFLSQHLARWATEYGEQLAAAASVAYWQSIGFSIVEVVGIRAVNR